MSQLEPIFGSVILAGERPEGSALSHAFKLSASVMVPVAGKPALARVMQAIEDSHWVNPGIVCGPEDAAINQDKELDTLLHKSGFTWLKPADGPAASALAATRKLAHYPVLLTAGDHALLTPEILDDFCAQVMQARNSKDDRDLLIGLVPYALVRRTWPQSKRTVLKFSNGQFCGSNLFAILNPDGLQALTFWRQAEADRKHPWRIARRFGLGALINYLLRRLSLPAALQSLSIAAGCQIGHVTVEFARAAIDVDSIADQQLAEKILLS